MRAAYYAKALHEALIAHPKEEEKLLLQFAQTVAGNGHAHLFPKIVKSFARIATKDEEAKTIEVTSAEPLAEADVVALLKKEPFKHALSASHKRVVRKTDATLVGGTVVRAGALRIDASYKNMLREFYQSLINT